MKKIISIYLPVLLIAIVFTSCSKNSFHARKNYQPRVTVEANHTVQTEEVGIVINNTNPQKITIKTEQKIIEKTVLKNQQPIKVKQPKESLIEKLVKTFFPKQKKMLDELKEKNDLRLNKAKGTKMDDAHITGLVLSLLALVLAITSMLMIIGMAHGNLWIYFAVGMILAAASITLAFITKNLLPFKGISLAAGTLGVIAIILLIIFMVLIVAGVVF